MHTDVNRLYEQTLLNAASRLTKDDGSQVDIYALCNSLSIPVAFGHLPGKARAAVVRNGATIQIRLLRKYESKSLSAWARFLIAHEIGHILLERECRATPMGKSEYWQHEKMCDAFAAALLVPRSIICAAFASEPRTSIGIFSSINRVASVANVPWLTAAVRVTRAIPSLVAFGAKREPNCTSESKMFRLVASTLPEKKELNRFIAADTKLGALFRELAEKKRVVPLDSSIFVDGTIPSCREARSGAVSSDGDGTFRVLVRFDEMVEKSH